MSSHTKSKPASDGHDANGHDPEAQRHASAEHRPPARIPHNVDEVEAAPDDMEDQAGSGELSAEEIQQETERWAPRTLRDTVAEPTTVEKICRVCGKDVRGHRRFKDERGYICLPCEREDRKRRLPCAECGKPTLPEGLRPWGPISICARCWMDHQADPKARVKRQVSSRPWEEAEKRTVLIMTVGVVVIMVVLLLIASC